MVNGSRIAIRQYKERGGYEDCIGVEGWGYGCIVGCCIVVALGNVASELVVVWVYWVCLACYENTIMIGPKTTSFSSTVVRANYIAVYGKIAEIL